MSNSSANLGLPFILASQAQKHITHNEALQRLDALVQLRLASTDATIPPVDPQPGETHALGVAPTGSWAGQSEMLATWDGSAWAFFAPLPGWRGWDIANARLLAWDGTAWEDAQILDNLDHLGINTTADAANRLAVAGDAALFTHGGSDHRLKVNKATAADTASLLFQSGFSGHAEIGLAGDNDIALKVSPDGNAWIDALVIDGASGLPSGEMIQTSATDTTPGRLARADHAYSPGNLLGHVSQSGGVPTGAVVERGSNANGDYVRFADGTQLCWNRDFSVHFSSTSALRSNWTFPAAFSDNDYAAFIQPTNIAEFNGNQRREVVLYDLNQNQVFTTYMHVRVFMQAGLFSAGDALTVKLSAIGRWF